MDEQGTIAIIVNPDGQSFHLDDDCHHVRENATKEKISRAELLDAIVDGGGVYLPGVEKNYTRKPCSCVRESVKIN